MWKNMSSYDAFAKTSPKMYMQMHFGNFIYKLLGKNDLNLSYIYVDSFCFVSALQAVCGYCTLSKKLIIYSVKWNPR